MSTHLELVQASFGRRKDIQNEICEIDEAASSEKRAFTVAESDKIASLRSEMDAVDSRITTNLEAAARAQSVSDDVNAKLSALLEGEATSRNAARSVGQLVASSEGIGAWLNAGGRGTSPAVALGGIFNAVTDVTSGATSGGAFVTPERFSRVGVDVRTRRTRLTDILPIIPISGPVEYVQDTSDNTDFFSKPVEVAEGQAKPQAGPSFKVVSESPATIPAWVNITRQVAADAPQLAGYIDSRLREAIGQRVDNQIVAGNGTSPNLSGLLDRDGILDYTADSGEADFAAIRNAMAHGAASEFAYTVAIVNPIDAAAFDLSNATTAGLHAVPNLVGGPAATMWGLTRFETTAVSPGTVVLVDPLSVAVLDRQDATSYLTDSHASNFTSNILTLLVEARLGLALFDPKGVCEVTLDAGS